MRLTRTILWVRESLMIKVKSLLHRYPANDTDNKVAFTLHDNLSLDPRYLEISRSLWESMHKPEEITMTLRPGNQMNHEEN